MKSILIIGLGRFGSHIAKRLDELRHEVMAIDKNEERINAALGYVTNALIGDSTNKEFLSSLGIKDYDACVVAIGDSFMDSLQTASLLKELGAKRVIARAATGVQEKFLLRNGADEVVYPEKQLASWTAIRCCMDHILDYIELDSDYSIFELKIPDEWQGKTVLQLDLRKKYSMNILAFRCEGKLDMKITPDTVFTKEKPVLVLCPRKSMQKLGL